MLCLAWSLASCQPCDASVCSDALWVSLYEPGGAALRDGTYAITIARDDASASGTCVVAQAGHSIRCEGLPGLYAPIYDDADNPHTVLQFFDEGEPPQHVALQVRHDGVLVLDDAFDPDYRLAEPEHCDPDCVHASVKRVFAR